MQGPWQVRYLLFVALLLVVHIPNAQSYRTDKATIAFESSARLENVEAKSVTAKGAIDMGKQQFAFSVEINSFSGFNSDLQKEHFRENYMETPLYPKATFTGKLIDPIRDVGGVQKVRAKGALSIHGVSRDRIIDVSLTRVEGGLEVQSSFYVALNDHQIVIPKLVFQKIAETIQVDVHAVLKSQ